MTFRYDKMRSERRLASAHTKRSSTFFIALPMCELEVGSGERSRVAQQLINLLLPQGPDPDGAAAKAHHHRRQDIAYGTLDAAQRNDGIHQPARASLCLLDYDVLWRDAHALLLSEPREGAVDLGCIASFEGIHIDSP